MKGGELGGGGGGGVGGDWDSLSPPYQITKSVLRDAQGRKIILCPERVNSF